MLLLLLGFGSGSVPRRVVSFFFVVDFANDSLLAKKQLSSRHCSSSFVESILFRIYSKPQGKGCKEPAEENTISVGTTFQPR